MSPLQKLLNPKYLILVIVVLIVVIAALILLLVRNPSKSTIPSAPEQAPVSEETTPPSSEEGTEEEEPEEALGTIEGSLSYPSEGIPSQMEICAEDTSTKEKHCTKTHIQDQKYTYGVGYKIEVPAGSYLVFAYFPAGHAGYEATYRAYYNEFVTCGLSVDCTSHDPIVVTVAAGQMVTEVDPQDWYVF